MVATEMTLLLELVAVVGIEKVRFAKVIDSRLLMQSDSP